MAAEVELAEASPPPPPAPPPPPPPRVELAAADALAAAELPPLALGLLLLLLPLLPLLPPVAGEAAALAAGEALACRALALTLAVGSAPLVEAAGEALHDALTVSDVETDAAAVTLADAPEESVAVAGALREAVGAGVPVPVDVTVPARLGEALVLSDGEGLRDTLALGDGEVLPLAAAATELALALALALALGGGGTQAMSVTRPGCPASPATAAGPTV